MRISKDELKAGLDYKKGSSIGRINKDSRRFKAMEACAALRRSKDKEAIEVVHEGWPKTFKGRDSNPYSGDARDINTNLKPQFKGVEAIATWNPINGEPRLVIMLEDN